MDAAMFSTTDPMVEVSANILMGQLCRFGTTVFDLVLDEEKLKDVPVGACHSRRSLCGASVCS
jgi:hypothetical protein